MPASPFDPNPPTLPSHVNATDNDHHPAGIEPISDKTGLNPAPDAFWANKSLPSAREEFRDALSASDLDVAGKASAWLQYWVTANTRGLTRGASKALALIVEECLAEGHPLEQLVVEAPHLRLGFARFFARGLIALAEQPRIAKSRLARLEEAIAGYAFRSGLGERDAAAVRLALNGAMGRVPEENDVALLWEAWIKEEGDPAQEPLGKYGKHGEAENDTSAAYCQSAMGQILVENLLYLGRTGEALGVARQTVEKSPCMSACALAPQGLLRFCLEPLRQTGDLDRAAQWERKLAGMAPPSHTWLAPTAARIRFLERSGHLAAAITLVDEAERFSREIQTSALQRLHYFAAAADVLDQVGDDRRSDAQRARREAEELARAFDQRNGNDGVSQRAWDRGSSSA